MTVLTWKKRKKTDGSVLNEHHITQTLSSGKSPTFPGLRAEKKSRKSGGFL